MSKEKAADAFWNTAQKAAQEVSTWSDLKRAGASMSTGQPTLDRHMSKRSWEYQEEHADSSEGVRFEPYDDTRNYTDDIGEGQELRGAGACDLCGSYGDSGGDGDLECIDGVSTCLRCRDDLHTLDLDDPLTVSLDEDEAEGLAAALAAIECAPYNDHEDDEHE